MIQAKTYLKIFIPAVLIVLLALTIRIFQYEPQFPKITEKEAQTGLNIPIFPQDPLLGNKKAPQTIIVFEDMACTHCAEQFEIFQTLLEQYPNQVKIIWKGLPIAKFPYDTNEAHAYAYCAKEQKQFIPFVQYAFVNGDNLSTQTLDLIVQQVESLDAKKLSTCLTKEQTNIDTYIAGNVDIARQLDIKSVPATFINHKQVVATSLDEWKAILNLQ
ncbi:DsbA family protein [Patescibacteria group bacterium]|nr:DsbA family protein [Patescibacteria group bacterium]MBU1721917.1 DsbA family protein [Patescibacteria group bacterium]MBU1901210.1 DsbA family protein [Patescibacteria group bacterium]